MTIRDKYQWTDSMGEISGFGGGYEAACRDMLYAGLEWLDAKPDADLKASTYANVFGILNAESPDTEALEKAVVAAVDGCTGAMHHAVMSHLLFIAKNGWAKYSAELSAREAEPPTEALR